MNENIDKLLDEYNNKMDRIEKTEGSSLDELIENYKEKMSNIDNKIKDKSEYRKIHNKFNLEKKKDKNVKKLIKENKNILKVRYEKCYPFLNFSDQLIFFLIALNSEKLYKFEEKYKFEKINKMAKNNKKNKTLYYELENEVLQVKYQFDRVFLDIVSKRTFEFIKESNEERINLEKKNKEINDKTKKFKKEMERIKSKNSKLEKSKKSFQNMIKNKEKKISKLENKKLNSKEKELIRKLEIEKKELIDKLENVQNKEEVVYKHSLNKILDELFYDSDELKNIEIDKSILEIINKKMEEDITEFLKSIKKVFKTIEKNEDIRRFKILKVKKLGMILVVNKNNILNYEFDTKLINNFKKNKKIINKVNKQNFYEIYDAEKRNVNLDKNKINYRSESSNYTNIVESELAIYDKYIKKFSKYKRSKYLSLKDYTNFFNKSNNFKKHMYFKTNKLAYIFTKNCHKFRFIRNSASHGESVNYKEYLYIRNNTFKILNAIQDLKLNYECLKIN
ncbi:MAG: hypothetical protein ACQEQF_06700 [Bacillota bacterium]